MSKTDTPTRISEDDLRNKLQSFQDGIQGKVEDKRSTLVAVGGTALVILLLVFFLLGKRSGKKKTTLVEIRRI
jgi:hypothetical protein